MALRHFTAGPSSVSISHSSGEHIEKSSCPNTVQPTSTKCCVSDGATDASECGHTLAVPDSLLDRLKMSAAVDGENKAGS